MRTRLLTLIAALALIALVGAQTDSIVITAAIKLVSLLILAGYGWLVPAKTEKTCHPGKSGRPKAETL